MLGGKLMFFYYVNFYNKCYFLNGFEVEKLEKCIEYVCNLEPQILRKTYVVQTDDGETWWDVDNSDIDFETGQLVHPETGELLAKVVP